MRSHANLWPRVTSFENLYEAFRQARKGKRARPDVAAFEFDLERHLFDLQRELLDVTYRSGGYRNFVVRDRVVIFGLRQFVRNAVRDRLLQPGGLHRARPLQRRGRRAAA